MWEADQVAKAAKAVNAVDILKYNSCVIRLRDRQDVLVLSNKLLISLAQETSTSTQNGHRRWL
jgi:hypothetical protein